MLGGHDFERIRSRSSIGTATGQPNDGALLALIAGEVAERFARLCDVSIPAVPVDLSGPEADEDPPPNPGHPACAEHEKSDYCRESWLLHRAELNHLPETHWHKCELGRLCAVVPIVYQDRCVAAVKLACPASVPQEDFERQVELLDVLARDFVASNADALKRLSGARPPAARPAALPWEQANEGELRQPTHPQILRAIQYIEEHLVDPKLSVARVAGELGLHPTYLSQLFADQVGRRMSRFIAICRVERAKILLATTNWQIKRIAHETGHANPNWFCRIFGAYTGLPPGEYRKASCNPSPAVPVE